jgi:GNAT superfamily N-acetyltransferase
VPVSDARVREVSAVDDGLRTALLRCWTDVTNAGGAVGFVPPVTDDDVAPVLDELLGGVRSGRNLLCVLEADGELVGWATLMRSDSPLRQHWASVLRVQVHPRRQGGGFGRMLMTGVHDIARRHAFEFLTLTVRGGTGLEGFYIPLGYVEVGRMPGALRLAPGDDRDEISMVCLL